MWAYLNKTVCPLVREWYFDVLVSFRSRDLPEFSHVFEAFIIYLYIMNLSCILVTNHEHVISFSYFQSLKKSLCLYSWRVL
jgi:hypothetical protein